MAEGTQSCPKCNGSGLANFSGTVPAVPPPSPPPPPPPSSPSSSGAAIGSPGVLSGNLVQVPMHVPVNIENSIGVIAMLNPALNPCPNCGGTGKVAVPG